MKSFLKFGLMLVAILAISFAFGDDPLAGGVAVLGMALAVKDAAMAGDKFVARGQVAGADYTAGIRGSGERWKANTKAGKDNWVQGVQESISRNAFEKGVDAAGAAGFEDRATSVGPQRFAQGIGQAKNKWIANTQPYLNMMSGLSLTPRGPKGSPQNQQRSAEVATANRRKKIGG
jgi:hypothetical protein